MGEEEDSDFKSQLVIEICSFSSSSSSRCSSNCKQPFIDWYLLLRVEEDADIEIIRKQYLKFALQLHPDKNKHPKAEIAFKLVSEAYACLSDRTKRRAFDSERWKTSKFQGNYYSDHRRHWTRSNKILKGIRQVRDKLNEEAKVIEKCLRVNNASRNEFPVFDPRNYFQDYPHHSRTRRIYNNNKPKDFCFLRSSLNNNNNNIDINARGYNNYRRGGGRCSSSPIFEIGSEKNTLQSSRSPAACFNHIFFENLLSVNNSKHQYSSSLLNSDI